MNTERSLVRLQAAFPNAELAFRAVRATEARRQRIKIDADVKIGLLPTAPARSKF
jgi:hypothetical protein